MTERSSASSNYDHYFHFLIKIGWEMKEEKHFWQYEYMCIDIIFDAVRQMIAYVEWLQYTCFLLIRNV